MITRALGVWSLLLLAAIVNGGLREALIVPSMGEIAAHAVSTMTLCATILALCWLSIGWIEPGTARDTWRIGGLWLALTLAFEFLAGHFAFGTPWRRLLADYDVAGGRIWVLALIVTATAPWLTARGRGLLPRQP